MKKKKSGFLILLIITGIILFGVIAAIVVRSTATVKAVVPNQDIPAGTKIESSMLKTIRVPVNTPKGYITDTQSLVGQKLKNTVGEDQLLYINDIMASWEDFSDGTAIPSDYVITSIQLPPERAVGGLITAGDYVDILGMPNSNYNTISKETMDSFLGDIAMDSYGADGINAYWVLANVRILETDSSLSQSNEASISTITQDSNSASNSSFYIVALSYSDYEKLRLCEQYLDLWMNICPAQNEENGPMLNVMVNTYIRRLLDAQGQSFYDENGKLDEQKLADYINSKPADDDDDDSTVEPYIPETTEEVTTEEEDTTEEGDVVDDDSAATTEERK